MASVIIKVKATGFTEANIAIGGVRERMIDLTVPLEKGALLMLRSIELNFRQAGRPIPWRPLARSTLIRKLKKGYSPFPLTMTGQLRRSVTSQVLPNKFILGTAVRYAGIHQFGGKAGRHHSATIPARPYLLFQREDLNRIEKLIKEHIVGG